jgi:hypothetical protein
MAFFILTDNKLHACDRALSIPRFDGIRGNTHFFAYGYAIRVVDRGGDGSRVDIRIRSRKRPDSIKKYFEINDGPGAVDPARYSSLAQIDRAKPTTAPNAFQARRFRPSG